MAFADLHQVFSGLITQPTSPSVYQQLRIPNLYKYFDFTISRTFQKSNF